MTSVGFSNVPEFNRGLDAWIKRHSLQADAGIRAIASRLFENVVRRTPVGDPDYWKSPPPPGYVGGYARANWWPSLNTELDEAYANGTPGDPPTSPIDFSATVGAGRAGDVFIIQNGVPYIEFLENGTASPRQAPQGMVKLSMTEIEQFFHKYYKEGADTI